MMKKIRDKMFEVLQKLGKSFMLPVAVLPAAGILLGIGSSFTNLTNLENLGLFEAMGPGTIWFNIFSLMSVVGSAVFDNLPLLFAIGIAIGLAEKDKGTAALAAALSYIVMHVTISQILVFRGYIDVAGEIVNKMAEGSIAYTLGIPSLQIGVFGGMIVGIGVALLHNKFHDIVLPEFLAFFGGNRFVPIVSIFVFIIVGVLLTYIWPPIQNGIAYLGKVVASGGAFGAFLFDFIKRLLIPFGLHHVFYTPFWMTALGGTAEIAGETYIGAQSILFAQLADPNTAHISRSASMYFMGSYPIMLFGLPAACLAMYKNAKKNKKKEAKSLLASAALTSIVTGITEPIEFPILFASPVLFGVHALLTGISNVLLYLLNVGVGATFSDGLIDLILLGVLPGNGKTNWIWIIPIGIVMFAIYFFVFDFAIKKFDLKTPGRHDDEIVVNALKEDASSLIVDGLGGRDNIKSVDCCATRLRVVVNDGNKVSEEILKSTGAVGVVLKGSSIQVIYGPGVNNIKSRLEDYMTKGISSSNNDIYIESPFVGKFVKIEDIPDDAFAQKTMGDGYGVIPEEDTVYAPADGKVVFVFPTKHAIGFMTKDNVSLLIHVGIDSNTLNGEPFEVFVKDNDEVKKGTPLMKVNLEMLKEKAKSIVSPVIVTDLKQNETVEVTPLENVDKDTVVIKIHREG